MTRQTTLLVVLGGLLIVVLWFLFLFKPASDDLATVNQEIVATQDQQRQLEMQLADLRDVRQDVTSIEATLAAYQTLITPDPGLPSLLRQLQTAANDSGMDLRSVAPGDPAVIEEVPEVASISVAIELSGGYFQLVDFLRRVEEPALTGRAVLVDDLQVSLDEYPTLTVGITARIFTTAEEGVVGEAPDDDPDAPNPTESPSPGSTDPAATNAPSPATPTEVSS